MHKPESVMKNEMQKFLWNFVIQTDYLIQARIQDVKKVNKKKKKRERTYRIVDIVVSVHHGLKIKENQKIDKYLDLPRELKSYGTWKVSMILIVIDALETILKELVWELEELKMKGWAETIQTTLFLRSVRIRKSVLKACGVLLV